MQRAVANFSTHRARIHLRSLLTFLLRVPRTLLYALIPGWLQMLVSREARAASEKPRLHATSHLDGLRGFAAIIVVSFHYLFAYRSERRHSWDTWIGMWDNPITEFFVSGVPMVAIFFVVSGYVISLKPLQLMHASSKDSSAANTSKKLLYTLCSSIFRRAFRIYLPPLTWTLIVALTVYYGFWEPSRSLLNRNELLSPGYNHDMITRTDKLSDEIRIWWNEWLILMNVLNWGDYYPHIGFHLWTVPIEYRSSIVLYALLLALSMARPIFRFAFLFTATYYVARFGRMDVMLFFAGAMLAEYRLVITDWRLRKNREAGGQKHNPIPVIKINSEPPRFQEKLDDDEKARTSGQDEERGALLGETSSFRNNITLDWPSFTRYSNSRSVRGALSTVVPKLFLYSVLLFSCYLLSTPKEGIPDTPGYGLVIAIFAPLGYGGNDGRWVQAMGAILILWCLLHMRPRRKIHDNESETDRAATISSRIVHFFNSRFAQYLGRNSFSIYIVHMAVLQCVGTWVVVHTWDFLRKSHPDVVGSVYDIPSSTIKRDELEQAVNDRENFAAWCWSLVVGWVVCIVVTVSVADVFSREVDQRCVKFARFVEKIVFVKGA